MALSQVGGYKLPFFVIGGLCILFTIPTFLLIKSTSELFIIIDSCTSILQILTGGSSQLLNVKMVIKLMSSFVLFLLCEFALILQFP